MSAACVAESYFGDDVPPFLKPRGSWSTPDEALDDLERQGARFNREKMRALIVAESFRQVVVLAPPWAPDVRLIV